MLTIIIIILGLVVFEVINSIDNAIVNAHVLKTMSPRGRRWFLLWGILTAVFLIRGVTPFLIIWASVPQLGIFEVFKATFSGDEAVHQLIEAKKFIILIAAGVFLLLLYFHWLFLEKKEPYFIPDKLIKPHRHGVWFFAFAAIILVVLLYLAKPDPWLMLAAAMGNAVFFILYGFREQAEKAEEELQKKTLSDFSKLMFLEILDASFSFDGVFGAFAFTTNLILILIGNGIGALVVRELTIKGIEKVSQYRFLKNGAMTSIGFLGLFMILESFHINLPEWLPTFVTILLVGITFWESRRLLTRKI